MLQSVKVRDYMSSNVMTFKPEDNAIEALRKLIKAGRSGGPVVDNSGELIGMISEIDCLKEALVGGYHEEMGDRVCDHMTSPVDSIDADANILSTADLFTKGRRRIPVVEEGRLVGIITRQDFGRALLDYIDNPHHGDNWS